MSIDTPKLTYHAALGELRQHVEFIALAMKIRMRSNEIFSVGQIGPQDRPTVNRFRGLKVGNGQATYEALYASICFHFEEFIRGIHMSTVEEINSRYSSIDQLSETILNNHIVATGTILSRHLSDARASKINVNLYAKNLGDCVSGSSRYILNADAFTFFLHGASCREIETVFAKIGWQVDWDAFGRNEKLRNFFRGGKAREIGKLTKQFVDEFVTQRNRIVHRGGGYTAISDALILSTIEFFDAFSEEFCALAKDFCSRYRTTFKNAS